MLKKILFLMFVMILLIGSVSALTATRNFSDNNISISETITVSMDVDGTGSVLYGVNEYVPNNWIVDNSSINKDGGYDGNKITWLFWDNNNRTLIYNVTAPATPGVYDFTGNYTDGVDMFEISGQTQVTVSGTDITPPTITNIQAIPTEDLATITWNTDESANSIVYYGLTTSLGNEDSDISLTTSHSVNLKGLDSNTLYYYKVNSCDSNNNCVNSSIYNFTTLALGNQTDDLMVNYVRGKITIDGENASAGTAYQVEVLSGVNVGYIYNGTVDDSNIPMSLENNGYYDTDDQVGFNTEASFKVSVNGFNNCYEENVFLNGGNGDFNTQADLVNLACFTINNPPELNPIGDKQVNENELLNFTITASDADNDTLSYYATDLPEGAVFAAQLFSWQTNYTDSGIYYVTISVSDGENWDNETITITVNNVNQPPVLEDIENQTILEDTLGSVLANTTDPDNDSLTYSITNENVSEVDCDVNDNNITFIPTLNWYGNASCEINVSDGNSGTDNKMLYIEVQAINDAPVLDEIKNVEVNENETVEITAIANDVDGDILNYTINDSRFTKNNNNNTFTWQTNYTDEGVYHVNVSVDDGILIDSQVVKITINHVNQPPQINPIANITRNEDSGFFEDGVLTATEDIGIDRFEVVSENTGEVDCSISDSILGVKPADDFSGTASCVIRVYDNENAFDETTVYIIVTNVNDAPIITDFSPKSNPTISNSGTQEFSITWKDIDNTGAEVMVRWYVDGVQDGIGNTYTFTGTGVENVFNITVIVSDLDSAIDSKAWNLTASNIPIINTFNRDTTNFTGMNDTELGSVFPFILERTGRGKVEFLEPVDLRGGINFDVYADIINLAIGIDTNQIPNLKNVLARLTFYDLLYEETPTIYYNSGFTFSGGNICPDSICSNIIYENNDLSFEVTSFSTFIVGDAPTCSEQSGDICSGDEVCQGSWLISSNIDYCCSIACTKQPLEFEDAPQCSDKSDLIEITIKEPDDSEDFKVTDTIKVKVKIKNNFDEKIKFDIESHLYDLDEDESLEDAKDDIKIKSGYSETIELEIEIPEDVEDNDFAIYVFVEDEEERCNSDYVKIDIEREKHNVIIEDIEVIPQLVSPGNSIEVIVKIENIGTSDEDAYITIENSELNILEQTEEFDIEEFGDDDSATKRIYVQIPKDAEEKNYEIKATVFFDGEENSDTASFGVLKKLSYIVLDEIAIKKEKPKVGIILDYPKPLKPEGLPVIKIKDDAKFDGPVIKIKETKPETKQPEFIPRDYTRDQILIIIDIFLIIGIIIEIILILIIIRRR